MTPETNDIYPHKPTATTLAVNVGVRSRGEHDLNVRVTPGGELTQPQSAVLPGSTGMITAGPEPAEFGGSWYTWYRVKWENGPHGWSIADGLRPRVIREAAIGLSDQWQNKQDVGAFYDSRGGIHPGEDWNYGSGDADVGKEVYATATGQVVDKTGQRVVIRHHHPREGVIYSIYLHINPSVTLGQWVTAGPQQCFLIGKIGKFPGTPAHLHFEMRKTQSLDSQLYRTSIIDPDTGQTNGYYSNVERGKPLSAMTEEEVRGAYQIMRNEGIIDPSDFIDQNRPGRDTGAVRNGAFALGSLGGWTTPEIGTVDVVFLAGAIWSHWARLTARSPATLSQCLATPASSFRINFDYRFTTTTGVLNVVLDSVVLGTVAAPAVVADAPSPFTVTVTDGSLRNIPAATLEFQLDGPTGSEVLISNVILAPARPLGDINGDCKVNLLDLIFIRNRIGMDVSSGDNWNADANGDGKINLLDLLFVRDRLNATCQ